MVTAVRISSSCLLNACLLIVSPASWQARMTVRWKIMAPPGFVGVGWGGVGCTHPTASAGRVAPTLRRGAGRVAPAEERHAMHALQMFMLRLRSRDSQCPAVRLPSRGFRGGRIAWLS